LNLIFANLRTPALHSDFNSTSEAKSLIGKIVLILGIVGILLGSAVLVISLLLPTLTDGRTSWDEAMFGIIPGVVVLVLSFIVFLVGLVVTLMTRKKKLGAA
jgi:hypothetical protein